MYRSLYKMEFGLYAAHTPEVLEVEGLLQSVGRSRVRRQLQP